MFSLHMPRPPISTLFPYTTLFRSRDVNLDLSKENASQIIDMGIKIRNAINAIEDVVHPEFPFINGLTHMEFLRIRFIRRDRKSTRLNSSHVAISYAVFCLKKKIKH